MQELKVHSIFESISGEAGPMFPQGAWTTFIRLQTCNLQCSYCDTPEAQSINKDGLTMTVENIMRRCYTKNILITGGEPLVQYAKTGILATELRDAGHTVQIETNGSYFPPNIPGVGWVMDIKCPSSGMYCHMPLLENTKCLFAVDNLYIKFVVQDLVDVDAALMYADYLSERDFLGLFLFSPANANVDMIQRIKKRIAEFDYTLLNKVVFSLQLHKIAKMP